MAVAWNFNNLQVVALAFTCNFMVTAGCDDKSDSPPLRHPLCDVAVTLCSAEVVAEPSFSPPVIVAPSDQMPAEVVSQEAHNNLDVAWHDPDGDGPEPGRLFFAFRTAPDHFASSATVMYVVSSPDLGSWRFEGAFSMNTDLREPQLVSIGGKLLFYFVMLGDDPLAFEPQGTRVVEWLGPGRFGEQQDVFTVGFLVWRIKAFNRPGEEGGWLHAFGYEGGENIYDLSGQPITVHWLKSRNGLDWEPVIAGQPIMLTGGASETDGDFLEDGTFIAVARNEAGDGDGFGSKICRAEAGSLGTWACRADKRKYDSPLVFEDGGKIWLIGRRNVTDTGHYDLDETELPLDERWISNQLAYWQTPKRCSLWLVDPDALLVSFVLDLPSAGDTCFPETIRLTANQHLLFNYSSPFADRESTDPGWLTGQRGQTHIHWTVVNTAGN